MSQLHSISQHWSVDTIFLSYFIAVSGSYCTIQLMEQWRMQESKQHKLFLLALSSVSLGGIWCMHFTGMNALNLYLDDGTQLEMNFEAGTTIVSLIFPILGAFIGLKIASADLLEVEQSKRKDILAAGLKHMSMEAVVKRAQMALGVLGMHYLGMMAQRTNAVMTFDAGVVSLSVVIAFVTANAAFWIIFRALTFLPNNEWLRLGSALIMGIAVCGTHYSGMGAASYTVSEEHYVRTSQFVVDGREAAVAASHGALLVCYWLLSFSVVRIAGRREQIGTATRHDSAGNPHTAAPGSTTISTRTVLMSQYSCAHRTSA
ncbi:hypothetical protein Gpo141_00013088 [Globisporangium polare]